MSELHIYEDLEEFDEIFGDLDMTMLHSGEKHRVFVYGTLMSGMRNHHRLEAAGAKLISKNATTTGDLKMLSRISSSGYQVPIVITGYHFEPKGIIKGEVYEVNNESLIMLDIFEGHPEVYQRQKVFVNHDMSSREMWMYIYVDLIPDDFCKKGITVINDPKQGFSIYKWRGL